VGPFLFVLIGLCLLKFIGLPDFDEPSRLLSYNGDHYSQYGVNLFVADKDAGADWRGTNQDPQPSNGRSENFQQSGGSWQEGEKILGTTIFWKIASLETASSSDTRLLLTPA
jgi:hypothetical protein